MAKQPLPFADGVGKYRTILFVLLSRVSKSTKTDYFRGHGFQALS